MNISDKGLDLILEFEGKLRPTGDGRYRAYRCPAGVLTIYAGCTEGVHDGQTCTEQEGREMFRREIAKHERIVSRLVTVDMTQAMFDSLVSFSYNCGGLAGSTLLRKLNAGDIIGASNEFRNWTKARNPATGKREELRGLVRRRKAEAAMFVSDMPGADEMPQTAEEKRPVSTPTKVTGGVVSGGVALEGARKAVDKGKEIKSVVADAKALVPVPAGIPPAAIGSVLIMGCIAVVLWFASRRAS